jgi:DNA-directed RNA polymerase subunit RPC12/RpoP
MGYGDLLMNKKVFIYICGNCKAKGNQPNGHERVSTGEANDRICPTCGEWSVFYYEKEVN